MVEERRVSDIERIVKMEADIIHIKEMQDKMDHKIDLVLEKLLDKAKRQDEIIEKYAKDHENKFASKWVENAAMAAIGFVILAVIGAILTYVIK